MSDSQFDLRDLIARAIDGDLSRAERRALFVQLSNDPAARHLLADMTGLEDDLADFGAIYDDAPVTLKPLPAAKPARRRLSLPAWVKPSSYGFSAGLAGGIAVAALALIFTGDLLVVKPAGDRLEVFAIAFDQTADKAAWSHRHDLESGQTVRMTLHSVAGKPLHLRLSGDGTVDMQVEHRRKDQAPQQDRIGGAQVHYAVLRDPQPGDEVIFRNAGAQTVHISLAADTPDAAQFHRQMAQADPR